MGTVLLVLFTTFFWTGCAYYLHRNRRVFGATSAAIAIFLLSRFDLLTGETVLGHIDTLGNLNQLYAFDSIIREHSFSSWLSAWNPFNNGGQPLLPKFNPHFYLLWGINFIDPWGLKLSVVHNYLAVNYIVIFAVGTLLLCHALIDNWKSAFFGFCLILFSTLLLVAYKQEIPRWIFMKPFIFLCLVEWVKRKNPWFLTAALGFFGVLAAQYLPNGTFLAGLALFLFFLAQNFSEVRKRVWNKPVAKATAAGLLLCALTASPTISGYLKMRSYVDGGRNFQSVYDKNLKAPINAPIRVHSATLSDLPSLLLNTRLFAEYHAWFYSGPFVLFFALFGLWSGFRQRSAVIIGVGFSTAVVLLSAFFPSVFYGVFPGLSLLRNGILILSDAMFGFVILAAFGFANFKPKKVPAIAILVVCCSGTFLSFLYTHRKEIDRRAKEVESGQMRMTLEAEPPQRFPAFHYPETRLCLGRNFRRYDFEESTACVTADSSRAHSGVMPERYARLLSIAYPKFFFSKDDYGLSDHGAKYALLANAGAPIFFFTNQAKFPMGELHDELRRMFRDYEGKEVRAAYFYPGDSQPTPLPSSLPATAFPVSLSAGTPSRVELRLMAPTAGYLVRTENYDADWKAELNGRAIQILYGNYAFQAIALPAGKSHVVFTYRPSYPWWFWLHQGAFVAAGVLWVINSLTRREF